MYWFNSLWYSIFNFTSDSLIFTTANIACFTKKKKKKKKATILSPCPFPYYHLLSFDRETGWAEVERIVPASATLQQLQQKWLLTIIVAAVKKIAMSANYAMSAHYAYARVVCIMFPHKSFTWQMIKSQLFNC